MSADDLTEGEHIEREKTGTEYGSLGDTRDDRLGQGFLSSQGDVFGSV